MCGRILPAVPTFLWGECLSLSRDRRQGVYGGEGKRPLPFLSAYASLTGKLRRRQPCADKIPLRHPGANLTGKALRSAPSP